MSKGKKTSTNKKFLLGLIIITVVVFLSTFVLTVISWIISGETLPFLVAIEVFAKTIDFFEKIVSLYKNCL